MDLRLRDKVIIVTGGASGIGEGICRKLAEEGGIPCILDRDEQNTLRVVAGIGREYGITPYYHLMDLTDAAACEEAVSGVLAKFGRIDGLVNNAGINDGVGLGNGTYEKFVGSLDKNVGHYFSVARAVLPALKLSLGPIVNICSKTANTKEWSVELRKYGIRVNAVVVTTAEEIANMVAMLLSAAAFYFFTTSSALATAGS